MKIIVKIIDTLPFDDDKLNTLNKQWTQVLNNPTSIASLLLTIESLEYNQKLTIERNKND